MNPDIDSDLELVTRQLECVKHFSGVISHLADSWLAMLPVNAGQPHGHHIIKQNGRWTHHFMEQVGELLNSMDASDEEQDAKWQQTFRDAAKRWKDEAP